MSASLKQTSLNKPLDAQARLEQVARTVLQAHPGNWTNASKALFSLVQGDAELLWQFFFRFRNVAANELLTAVSQAIREEARKKTIIASPNNTVRNKVSSSYGGETHEAVSSKTSSGQSLPRSAAKGSPSLTAVSKVATLSLLDTFKVNGQPVGSLTPNELAGWPAAHRRNAAWEARFVELLIENLPPDHPVSKFRTAEDAVELRNRAVQETKDTV